MARKKWFSDLFFFTFDEADEAANLAVWRGAKDAKIIKKRKGVNAGLFQVKIKR
jgi:hypothetical protein